MDPKAGSAYSMHTSVLLLGEVALNPKPELYTRSFWSTLPAPTAARSSGFLRVASSPPVMKGLEHRERTE